jgi:hypothetical protein
MIRWKLAGLSFGVALFVASSAAAQPNATLVLTSGERVAGQLVDMSGSGFTVRSSGQERQLATGSVAVIDFAGDGQNLPPSELNNAGSGPGIVLSSGEWVKGRLFDVGGSNPLRLSVKTDTGQRDFRSNEVRRVYFSRPGSSSSSPSQSSTAPGTVRVPATARWVDSGVTVLQGQTITFETTGEVRLSSDSNDVAVPAGARSGRRATGAPMPNALAGALIGRIGSGAPFGIGNQTTVRAPATGRLYLSVNDDELSDNSGEFTVKVNVSGAGQAQPRRR